MLKTKRLRFKKAGIGVILGIVVLTLMSCAPKAVRVTYQKPEYKQEKVNARKIILEGEKKGYDHAFRFEKYGITSYEGPKTCLQCHKTIRVKNPETGQWEDVNTMKNVTESVHMKWYSIPAYTYNVHGEKEELPMGMIDRACGIPGAQAGVAWALQIKNQEDGKIYFEGCGQCHIGGTYGPPVYRMMREVSPMGKITKNEKESVDCLICHAKEYDISKKIVVKDKHGLRWAEDRSLKAAVSVGKPTTWNCRLCHDHNFVGDNGKGNVKTAAGTRSIIHQYVKRGSPYTPEEDVHAAAGMNCLDCHKTYGHFIAKGKKTCDLVANDLPNVDVTCEQCHTDQPHKKNEDLADILNTHTEKLSCTACHIRGLPENNIRYNDWKHPVYEDGFYVPKPTIKGGTKSVMAFKWFNGTGGLMATPNGDRNDPKSKITPFKIFNAMMAEDSHNAKPDQQGWILSFDPVTYMEEGNPEKAIDVAQDNPYLRMFYGLPMKLMFMNHLAHDLGYKTWDNSYYKRPKNDRYFWTDMRSDGYLMLDHGIKAQGRSCNECHSKDSILNFKQLGYSQDEIESLQEPRE